MKNQVRFATVVGFRNGIAIASTQANGTASQVVEIGMGQCCVVTPGFITDRRFTKRLPKIGDELVLIVDDRSSPDDLVAFKWGYRRFWGQPAQVKNTAAPVVLSDVSIDDVITDRPTRRKYVRRRSEIESEPDLKSMITARSIWATPQDLDRLARGHFKDPRNPNQYQRRFRTCGVAS